MKHYIVKLQLFPQEFHISADSAEEAEIKAKERLMSCCSVPADKSEVFEKK